MTAAAFFLRTIAGPVFVVGLAVLAVSMFMQPLDPSYGVVDALRAGWSL